MKEVWLVRVVYQYDGYDTTEVYDTKEKACDAADQLVFEFKESGYKNGDGFDDILFIEDMDDDMDYIILENKFGEVEITVEKKTVR
jgi:hypothetical protein